MTVTDMQTVYMKVNFNKVQIFIPILYSSFQGLPATLVVVIMATSNWEDNVWKSKRLNSTTLSNIADNPFT